MTTRVPAPAVPLTAPVRLERDGAVVHLVLACGDSGNGFDLDFVTALRAAVEQLVTWTGEPDRSGVGAVLLRAEGPHFSVGGDLRAFAAQGSAVGGYVRRVAEAAHAAVLGLAALPVPVVAAIQGAVAGGGVGLSLGADLAVAARSAKLRLAYTALGLTPDCGASWFLPRLVGERRALDLVFTNRVLGAVEAEQWGLFNRVVDDADLPSVAGALASALASGQVRALGRAKLLVRAGRLDELRDHLDCEAEFIAEAAERPEVGAAMGRFVKGTRRP
ncbi:2-(1,2-epoxy-1,2-dihydrophenyl)acetyl-CoA isomerase [Streptomyces sp. SAI-135]|jgi:2-(1,2-epoxy-1,2-dihydrophenyl)acetyl-CoA isomerase|uniref:enoyl-CoA hydratase/isomerase family protein n=1 Tax=unclassified Streptomyces TaxID=2593676 RepID=UPI002476286A|nr:MULTISPECIES: enoyl-CoA hydratase/isomerase family protein [unclassified Streptomyces]MDH6521937.1 2-(1,2-epoxy-1,2-dihydrophenyl)acetyl-CoA isomerase [Streptomyces sp. SAI-090]MDH6573306.1 2-(1,2-epoxy-1,2-dihydrophenyl)acetyl-CoA isomerase [Streptomyces sp. SAI-117]MDH6613961.1 2-(1,2-epoxy-1,2-dihydrophenyl)acetyl-CoA isomerase [Streptomyces sp. SAI-135]